MVKRKYNAGRPRALAILGISELEEEVYEYLLECSDATVIQVAIHLNMTPSKAKRVLESIESKALASHTLETPRSYTPVSPDIALSAKIHRHQEALQHARTAMDRLQESVGVASRTEKEKILELVTSPEGAKQVLDQLLHATQQEALFLIRAPILITPLDAPIEVERRSQREAQRRGVRCRSIVDHSFLELPRAIQNIRADMKAGEVYRLFPELPFKMILADRRIALIPLHLESKQGPSLIVRSSALLDALYALFELLWRDSAPIAITNRGEVAEEKSDSGLTEEAEHLVTLLAAGVNDKSAASEMDLSMRTFYRRLEELMKDVNARTRFQLGWNLGVSQEKR